MQNGNAKMLAEVWRLRHTRERRARRSFARAILEALVERKALGAKTRAFTDEDAEGNGRDQYPLVRGGDCRK
jgi:hypothetical protein